MKNIFLAVVNAKKTQIFATSGVQTFKFEGEDIEVVENSISLYRCETWTIKGGEKKADKSL